jgi:hypothetical protein
MARYSDYLGTIPSDGIQKYILPKVMKGQKVAFVINTDPERKSGEHWTSIFIDPVGSHSVEYFDSFAQPIPPHLMRDIKLIVDKIQPDSYLKFKENKIVEQRANSSNCGEFAIRFLVDRLRGNPFKDVTGYSEALKGEKDIDKFKQQFQPFKYLQ